jgi:rare lipoprotein A
MLWGNAKLRNRRVAAVAIGAAGIMLCAFAEPAAVDAAAIDPLLAALDELAVEDAVFASAPAEPMPTLLGSGRASYYAAKFHGRRTANGERFDNGAMTAAHRSLPMGSMVKVTCDRSGRSVTVRVNDRGPFVGNRVIDLSQAAARELGMLQAGTTSVTLELLPTS